MHVIHMYLYAALYTVITVQSTLYMMYYKCISLAYCISDLWKLNTIHEKTCKYDKVGSIRSSCATASLGKAVLMIACWPTDSNCCIQCISTYAYLLTCRIQAVQYTDLNLDNTPVGSEVQTREQGSNPTQAAFSAGNLAKHGQTEH